MVNEEFNVSKLSEDENVEGLIKLLTSQTDIDTRYLAAFAMRRIGKRAVKPLISALKHESWTVRRLAAWGLAGNQDGAFESLLKALDDSDWMVRIGAAWALGKIGDERALKPLNYLLQDGERGVRLEAAIALGKIGQSGEIILKEAFKHENPDTRKAAEIGLLKLTETKPD